MPVRSDPMDSETLNYLLVIPLYEELVSSYDKSNLCNNPE